MSITITSLQNARVKQVVKLSNRRYRDEHRLTVVEGAREAWRALQAGIVPQEAFWCPSLLDSDQAEKAAQQLQQMAASDIVQLFMVTSDVFAKMAYRGQSGGVLLVIPYVPATLAQLPVGEPAFLAVIDGAEKPGNVGAILRTADAAGVDGVIVCGAQSGRGTDLHNPNVVRASLGTLFTVPVASTNVASLVPWLRDRGICIVATTPGAKRPYTTADLTGPVAIVSGSEAYGLTDKWLETADAQVHIPMKGAADSLNLATATALLLYEVVRQRNQPRHPPQKT